MGLRVQVGGSGGHSRPGVDERLDVHAVHLAHRVEGDAYRVCAVTRVAHAKAVSTDRLASASA